MKLSTSIAMAAVILAVGIAPASAAKQRDAAYAQREASCKAQAAKKYSAVRVLARRDFVNKCMGHSSMAKATTHKQKATMAKKQKMEPSTTGQKTQ
jgi:hypothetical protein